jgi:hypothetical protein
LITISPRHRKPIPLTFAGAPLLTLAGAALLMLSGPAHASRTLLTLVPGARLNGLAGAGVADASDPGTVWISPANAGPLRGAYASAYGGEVYGFGDEEYAGGFVSGGGRVYERPGFAVGLGGELRYQQLDDLDTFDDGERTRLGDYISAAVGTDLIFNDQLHISVGGAYKRVTQNLPVVANPDLYDIGIRAGVDTTWGSGWTLDMAFALSYRNQGEDYATYGSVKRSPPTVFTTGLSLGVAGPTRTLFDTDVPLLSVRVNLDRLGKRSGVESSRIIGGGEVGLWQLVWLRVGWVEEPAFGVGLGAKLDHIRFRIDYARVEVDPYLDYPDTQRDKISALMGWEW